MISCLIYHIISNTEVFSETYQDSGPVLLKHLIWLEWMIWDERSPSHNLNFAVVISRYQVNRTTFGSVTCVTSYRVSHGFNCHFNTVDFRLNNQRTSLREIKKKKSLLSLLLDVDATATLDASVIGLTPLPKQLFASFDQILVGNTFVKLFVNMF